MALPVAVAAAATVVVAVACEPAGEAAEGAGGGWGLQLAGADDGAVVPAVEEAEEAVVHHDGEVRGEEDEAAPDV